MKHNRRRSPGKPRVSPTVLDRLNPHVAGIDCGVGRTFRGRPAGPRPDAGPVRSATFTTDLLRLADWLTACRVTSVAMEATGVYWIPIYEILEARGIEVLLVNARHLKNVPGRKSDVSDCEWIRELHSVGLAAREFSAHRRHRGAARLSSPSPDADRERRHVHPAHAEGAGADECATAVGGQRYHRRHRPADPA